MDKCDIDKLADDKYENMRVKLKDIMKTWHGDYEDAIETWKYLVFGGNIWSFQ